MSIQNFIPEVWAAEVQRALYAKAVFTRTPVTNRNYESIVGSGSEVKINQIGKITNAAYAGSVTYPEMDDAQRILKLDQKRYLGVKVPDIDAFQANVELMSPAVQEMADSFTKTAETYVASLYSDASITSASTGVTSGVVAFTAATAEQYFADMMAAMGDADVPMEGRWVVLPHWAYSRTIKALGAVVQVNNDILAQGALGRAYGFNIYASSNVHNNGTNWDVMAGTSNAITFADQINMMEAFRDKDSFSDLLRGLRVYGAKVVRPDQLFWGIIKKA